MNTKIIKQLAMQSFTNGQLDEGKLQKIWKRLARSEQRVYLKFLKIVSSRNSVKITVASKLDKESQNTLKKIFKNKKIEITQDNELLAGIKIQDYDTIYDLNLKNSLNSMVNFVKE
jgi:hypothetical protein